jgi:YVTN family beta-propeller protein
VWPSGDGRRIYVGLENADALAVINTASNQLVATVPIGQAPQAIVYVPDAVPNGEDAQGLQSLGVAGQATHLSLVSLPRDDANRAAPQPPTSVTLFDQGLVQVLQAAVTGLQAKQSYVLALSNRPTGGGALEALAAFTTNPAGSAIVNAVGPIRQIVRGEENAPRRFLVIVSGTPGRLGPLVQIQAP